MPPLVMMVNIRNHFVSGRHEVTPAHQWLRGFAASHCFAALHILVTLEEVSPYFAPFYTTN